MDPTLEPLLARPPKTARELLADNTGQAAGRFEIESAPPGASCDTGRCAVPDGHDRRSLAYT